MNKQSSYRWVILAITFLAAFLTAFCQFQATAYAPDLMGTLGLSEVQYASIATAPMLIGVFLSLVAGATADKIGVKKLIFIGLIITTIGNIGRAFAGNYGLLLICGILAGVVGVFCNSNNTKIMSSWFSPAQMGLALGIMLASGNTGTIVAMVIGRNLTPNYTQAFLIGGIAFAVETVLWIILIRERKPEIPVDAPEMPKTKVGDVLKNKYIWLAGVAAALFMGVNMAAAALLSPGLLARGVSEISANTCVVIYTAAALVGSIVLTGIIPRTRNTKITAAIIAVITGVTLYCAWIIDSDGARFALLAISGFTVGPLIPTIMSIPARMPEIGPMRIGLACGLISTVMMAGAYFLPSNVITPLAGGINNTTFLIAMILAIILAVLFLILPNVSLKKMAASKDKNA